MAGAIRRQPIASATGKSSCRRPAPPCSSPFAVADIACAAAVLHALLPAEAAVSYPRLLCVPHTLAISAGLISHVPGGLGVFESALLLGLPDVPKDVLLGSAIAYRAVYFLLPFVLAAALGLSNELASKHSTAGRGIACGDRFGTRFTADSRRRLLLRWGDPHVLRCDPSAGRAPGNAPGPGPAGGGRNRTWRQASPASR